MLQEYRIKQVIGDNYAAEWVTATFKDAGIKFVRSEHPKSQLYLEVLPLFTRGLIAIPDLPPLLKELRLLERQTHRSGKDTVDHGKRGSDDLANALAGCAAHCVKKGSYRSDLDWIHGGRVTPGQCLHHDLRHRMASQAVRPIRRLRRIHQTLLNRSAIMTRQVQQI